MGLAGEARLKIKSTLPDKTETDFVDQVTEVSQVSGTKIIQSNDGMSFCQKSVAKMRAEEACRPSDKDFLRLH